MIADPQPLPPVDASRLVEFARACKAAARAVTLYPDGHPAIAATLGRIAALTSFDALREPLRVQVLADDLRLDGRNLPRTDPAIAELAGLLHAHSIGELIVHPDGDFQAWRTFLLLLGRPADAVRSEGGIAQLWTAGGGRHVELREIDYAHVLRERPAGQSAAWEQILASCLRGEAPPLDDEAVENLLKAAGDSVILNDLMATVEAHADRSGPLGPRVAALVRLLERLVDAVSKHQPSSVEPAMQRIASAVGQLSPDMVAALLSRRSHATTGVPAPAARPLADAIVSHMSDETIAGFVARHAFGTHSSLARVAQAFQTLVRDSEHGERLLRMAHDRALETQFGSQPQFEARWSEVAGQILTSYSDTPFVSAEYARELTEARDQAVQVEELREDPPERVSAWLGTVATGELSALDLMLVEDLLRLESDDDKWTALMRPVISLIEERLLVGHIEGAEGLVRTIACVTDGKTNPRRTAAARHAVEALAAGPMVRHVVTLLAVVDAGEFERIRTMCLSLGDVLARSLADALSTEEGALARERLAAILIGFGASGRREAERLTASPSPAIRRSAIQLLRGFGGAEAMSELERLLADRDPQVQREAVRAILHIGSGLAIETLGEALLGPSSATRDAIMQALGGRDERAVPLFARILTNVDPQGPLGPLYARAIDALGSLKSPAGIPALREALYRGEWWAPRRSAALRVAAAGALARIGTDRSAGRPGRGQSPRAARRPRGRPRLESPAGRREARHESFTADAAGR